MMADIAYKSIYLYIHIHTTRKTAGVLADSATLSFLMKYNKKFVISTDFEKIF